MPPVMLSKLGTMGIMKDIPPHLLPPEAWSDGNNMRMVDSYAKRFLGYSQVFGTPSITPGFVFYVPATADNFWLYANLTAVYGYDGAAHTDITRSAGAVPYTATEYRNWGGCILGGVPILNNGADVPQYWPTLSLGTDLANLTAWPATLRAKRIKNFGRFLVALNLIDTGTPLPHAVQWSHPADPGTIPSTWDPNDATADAGRTHLTDIEGGDILDAFLLGNYLVIYKERSCHLMRFIGGIDIFGFELLFNSGLLAARCCAVIDSGMKHFCVTEDDVIIHAATKNIEYPLDKKDRRYLFNDMDATNYVNAHAFDNPSAESAWFAYPSSGATFPNKALVYNYRDGSVAFKDFVGTSVDIGRLPAIPDPSWDSDPDSWDVDGSAWEVPGSRRIVAADPTAVKLWGLDTGLVYGTASTTSFLQRTGWAIVGKDRSGTPIADYYSRKLFKRIWPKVRGNAVVQVRMGAQEEIDGSVTWAAYQTFNPAQKYLDFEVNGRLGAIEYRSTSDADWQIEGHDIEVEVLGNL